MLENCLGTYAVASPVAEALSVKATLAYYIRKLLRQNLRGLKSVVAPGAALTADSFNDLDAVLESLYLETDTINSVVKELEKLTLVHQGLAEGGRIYQAAIAQCEERLFWLLGFKYVLQASSDKILIVDDSLTILTLLGAEFNRAGYKTYTTADGNAMMPIVHAFRPDLVLMDVNMPGMNGYEACEALKRTELGQRTPVLFISSVNRPEDKAKALSVGAVDYLVKPPRLKNIVGQIERYLN